MAVTQGSPGKKFLPDLVFCCLFLAPKPVPLRDFGPGFTERTPSQRARFCQTNLRRCNPECWKQRGWQPSSSRSIAAFSFWKSSNQWSPFPSCWKSHRKGGENEWRVLNVYMLPVFFCSGTPHPPHHSNPLKGCVTASIHHPDTGALTETARLDPVTGWWHICHSCQWGVRVAFYSSIQCWALKKVWKHTLD